MFKCLLLVFTLNSACADYVFRYTNEYPKPPYIEFNIGKDTTPIRAFFDLNRDYSFAFSERCKNKRCDASIHNYTYDPKITGGHELSKYFSDARYGAMGRYYGKYFNETIKFAGLELPVDLGVISSGSFLNVFKADGVFGLGFNDNRSSIVKRLFKQLGVNQIIIQEGKHLLEKPGKPNPGSSSGEITFGRSSTKCGRFTYYNTVKGQYWQFYADVKIGNECFRGQLISFMPGRSTEISVAIHNRMFKSTDYETDKDFPEFGFIKGDKEYKFIGSDYSNYREARKKFYPEIKYKSSNSYAFGFGSDLLQHYCLALKANADFSELQIGLAENLGNK